MLFVCFRCSENYKDTTGNGPVIACPGVCDGCATQLLGEPRLREALASAERNHARALKAAGIDVEEPLCRP